MKKLIILFVCLAAWEFEQSIKYGGDDAWAYLWMGYARYNNDMNGAKAAMKRADQLDKSIRRTEHGESIKALLGY